MISLIAARISAKPFKERNSHCNGIIILLAKPIAIGVHPDKEGGQSITKHSALFFIGSIDNTSGSKVGVAIIRPSEAGFVINPLIVCIGFGVSELFLSWQLFIPSWVKERSEFFCGSKSNKIVFFPAKLNPVARWIAVVVFPTPPFWFAQTRIISLSKLNGKIISTKIYFLAIPAC